MSSVRRFLVRALLLFGVLVAAIWYLVPAETVQRGPDIMPDLTDPSGWLAAREAARDDIMPDRRARIVWAGEANIPTDIVLVYIHGFAASSEDIRPLPDEVADAFGANLIFARLPGHGRDGKALAERRAGDWVDDTAAMLRLARGIGDRVVIVGSSIGGTLASWAATDPEMARDVAAMVMISPAYALAEPLGSAMELPLARAWVPWVAGREQQIAPQSERHATFWTTAYPTTAEVTLATLMRDTRERDFSAVTTPALFIFADTDQVVSATATRDVAEVWGGSATIMPVAVPDEGGDPRHHVIAGDILSPALTDRLIEDIMLWLRDTLE